MTFSLRLRPKVIIGISLILFICMFCTGALFLVREKQRLQDESTVQGQALATLVAKFCATPIKKFSIFIVEEVARNVEEIPDVVFCQIYDSADQPLVQLEDLDNSRQQKERARNANKHVQIISTPIMFEQKVIGQVEIGIDQVPIAREVQAYMVRLGINCLIVLGLVAASLGSYLSLSFISPVLKLSAAAKNIGRGDFVETRIARRSDEIGDLARSFNDMSSNFKKLYQDLERKVGVRTADLAKANRQLHKEIQVRRQAEKEMIVAKETAEQANRYKSTFIANMSHELRTPLNAILGYTQILQRQDGLDTKNTKALKAIDQSGGRLLGLINDILNLSRLESGRMELKPTVFDLALLLKDLAGMYELCCQKKELAWKFVGMGGAEILPVRADAGKIRQILINLLDNALEVTEQGKIVLRVLHSSDRSYRFCVEDSGRVPCDLEQSYIFEPMSDVTGNNTMAGSGLGLAISSRFLGLMDSRLEILKNTPQGSRLCFELNLPPVNVSLLPDESTNCRGRGLVSQTPLTALIVDDDKLSRSMLSLSLNVYRINTVEASGGLEAQKMLEHTRPDIIFMDRYMPDMDGIETINHIRLNTTENITPIVMITAADLDLAKGDLQDLGIADMLTKPCHITDVLHCMASVLDLPLELESEAAETDASQPTAELSLADYSLPGDFLSRLMQAAEYGRISELKQLIAECESNPAVSPAFMDVFKARLEIYDLEGVSALLARIETNTQ